MCVRNPDTNLGRWTCKGPWITAVGKRQSSALKEEVGVLEYWSFGVMGENRTERYKPCFRAYRDMINCTVKVIGQKQIQGDGLS